MRYGVIVIRNGIAQRAVRPVPLALSSSTVREGIHAVLIADTVLHAFF
jgi:hypothetical protein